MPIQFVESDMTKMTASPPCVMFKWLCLTVFQLCVIDTQTEHVWTLDMVDRSHIGSEVESDSINRNAIVYLVGNDTLTLFLWCLVPKIKHVKTFDMMDTSGGHFELYVKSASSNRMGIPNTIVNHILIVFICCLVPKLSMFYIGQTHIPTLAMAAAPGTRAACKTKTPVF